MEKSEHVEFDVDAFLASIPRPPTKQGPQCPRCIVDVTFGSIQHDDGSQFRFVFPPSFEDLTVGVKVQDTFLQIVELFIDFKSGTTGCKACDEYVRLGDTGSSCCSCLQWTSMCCSDSTDNICRCVKMREIGSNHQNL